MSKKVIVACGGAVATSTIAAQKVKALIDREGLDATVEQVRINEIPSNLPADLIVPTSRFEEDYGVPVITGTGFISGLGEEELEQQILEVLQGE